MPPATPKRLDTEIPLATPLAPRHGYRPATPIPPATLTLSPDRAPIAARALGGRLAAREPCFVFSASGIAQPRRHDEVECVVRQVMY